MAERTCAPYCLIARRMPPRCLGCNLLYLQAKQASACPLQFSLLMCGFAELGFVKRTLFHLGFYMVWSRLAGTALFLAVVFFLCCRSLFVLAPGCCWALCILLRILFLLSATQCKLYTWALTVRLHTKYWTAGLNVTLTVNNMLAVSDWGLAKSQ